MPHNEKEALNDVMITGPHNVSLAASPHTDGS